MIALTITELIIATLIIFLVCCMPLFFFVWRYLAANHCVQLLNLKIAQSQTSQKNEIDQLKKLSTQYDDLLKAFNKKNVDYASLQENVRVLTDYKNKKMVLEKELNELKDKYSKQFAELTQIKTRLEETEKSANEKIELLKQSELRLTEQFENIANRIFTQSNQKIEQQHSQNLKHLLTPLKEQLEGFRKQVQDNFGQEARERHTLTHEIRNLQQLNTQIAEEAINLTNALKGNNKMQGSWGEVILNRILDSSGLREGHEYETQVSLQNESGRKQPDVIVHLPQGNSIIIDAKVTLVSYERYFNSHNDQEKSSAVVEHLTSLRQHIKNLSDKNYQKLLTVKSLDYVLMFIPIEPAFLVAIDQDPSLIDFAFKHNIMLVSPTTLLVALKTIHNLWKYEYQNRHSQDIAEKAAKLYDKMCGFVDDMQNLGVQIKRSEKTFNEAMIKLSRGRGNAIGQLEKFRDLGITIKKPIDKKITDIALEELLDNH